MFRILPSTFLLLALLPIPDTKLSPGTTAAFDSYAKAVEQELAARWSGHSPFFATTGREALMKGGLLIQAGSSRKNPIEISGGLIHDWTGTIFLPYVSIDRVLAVMQNFDRHAQLYPEVIRSRLIQRRGNDLIGYWRLSKKEQLVEAVFDVEQDAHYQQVAPNRWTCRSYAKNIREVKDAGTPQETVLPAGVGSGIFWRMYSYWSLEATNNGVLAELRTLSLSRGIPAGMGWIVKPFIQNVPRESLTSTLENTRKAVT
jgi:hypothetical protein